MGQFDYARGWTDDLSGLPQTQQPRVPVNVGANPYPSLPSQPIPQMPQLPQQGGGMFGGGKANMLQILAGALNGYLAGSAGPGQQAGLQGLQMLAAHRQRLAEHQQSLDDYNRKRTDDNADYVTHLQQASQYKTNEPHYFEDNSGNQWMVGSDGKPQMVYKDPLHWKLAANGMGGVVPVDVEALMNGQGGGAPAKPLTDAEIARMMGGQTPPASGTFPR